MVNRRDGVVCLSPEAGATTSSVRGARGASVRPRSDRERAAHGVVDARRRPARASCPVARSRVRAYAGELVAGADQRGVRVAAPASSSSTDTKPAGPSTTSSACATSSGGASTEPTAMRTACSRRPSDTSQARAAKASRSPRSSPAKQAFAAPRPAPPPRCPCRRAPAAYSRPSSSVHGQAVVPRDPVDDFDGFLLPFRGRAPVDGDSNARLALDVQVGKLVLDLAGGGRDGLEIGLGAGIDDRPPVDHAFEPVLADEDEPGDVDRPSEELDRPPADHGHGRDHADETPEGVAPAGRRAAPGSSTIAEIEPSKSTGRPTLRSRRTGAAAPAAPPACYCPTRTTQFTFSVSGSGGCERFDGRAGADVALELQASLSKSGLHCTAVPRRVRVGGGAS